jgi:hypothetical protein
MKDEHEELNMKMNKKELNVLPSPDVHLHHASPSPSTSSCSTATVGVTAATFSFIQVQVVEQLFQVYVQLKQDSEDTVDIGTDIISRAIIDKTG